jgi:arabinofuranosyltransferase
LLLTEATASLANLIAGLQKRRDFLAGAALVGVIAIYAFKGVDFHVPPFEDAAMLMRYSQNLAAGHGIVWNVGDQPVDGATDFLFMTATALLVESGVALTRAVRVLGLGAHVVTVLLVYTANRRIWHSGAVVSLVAAASLAVGTGLWYVAAYFGTTFFACLATVTWILALILIRQARVDNRVAVLFALSSLSLGLARPEGVLLAALMTISIIIARGWKSSVSTAVIFAMVMLVLGGAYFTWRWRYFGYPLPNPFYKKGGGIVHWDSFWESLDYVLRFGGPFLVAFVLAFRSARTTRLALAFMAPVLGFAAAFILISNETNFGGRFQYAVWPLILVSFYPLIDGAGAAMGLRTSPPESLRPRLVWVVTAAVIVGGIMMYAMRQSCSLTISQTTCGVAYEADGRYDVGKALSKFQDKGYTLATSEAGLLPLYSNWRAIDVWGLNDQWIAHHGAVTADYLDRFKPELIVFHAYFSPLVPPRINEKNMAQAWFRMTITLKDYAESRDYVLAAVFGDSPYESHYYYVRRGFADSDALVQQIAHTKSYYWYATGRKAINYAKIQLP